MLRPITIDELDDSYGKPRLGKVDPMTAEEINRIFEQATSPLTDIDQED